MIEKMWASELGTAKYLVQCLMCVTVTVQGVRLRRQTKLYFAMTYVVVPSKFFYFLVIL